jgi:hypothetical protein
LKKLGHTEQSTPSHALRHAHVQPVAVVPLTPVAWFEQLAPVVHRSEHSGYPVYPGRHAPQFCEMASPVGHVWQCAPVQPLEQMHWQPVVARLPLGSATARPLQSSSLLQPTGHAG